MANPPHPANAPGDFYVEEGCCITCGVPMEEAPEVFAWAGGPESDHCVVAHQPRTAQSIDRTLNAMWSSEVDCIRYRGADHDIVRRIVEMGNRDLCDQDIETGAAPLIRYHVRFSIADASAFPTAKQLALSFLHDFTGRYHRNRGQLVRRLLPRGGQVSVRISWFDDVEHDVAFERLPDGQWHIVAKPSNPNVLMGLSRIVERWMETDVRFQNIRWFSEAQWRLKEPGQATVL